MPGSGNEKRLLVDSNSLILSFPILNGLCHSAGTQASCTNVYALRNAVNFNSDLLDIGLPSSVRLSV